MNEITKIRRIADVIDKYNEIRSLGKNVYLILDVDDVVLSSRFGRVFPDSDICILVDLAYENNKSNLLFLTSRDKSLVAYTRNKLNKSGLLHKGCYINYNVLTSPLDENDGSSLKGPTFLNYIGCENLDDTHVIFVDDLYDNIQSMETSLSKTNATYSLFHFIPYK